MPLKLVLEDGEVFEGVSFGHCSPYPCVGEVVFNTGMVGYTEALTDPSYSGQILCFTYPLIGNYGVPEYIRDENQILLNFESDRIQAKAVIANRVSKDPSHFECKKDISSWMKSETIPGIEGLDTRELTLHLRSRGVMMGAIAKSVNEANDALAKEEKYSDIDFCSLVSTKKTKTFGKNVNGKIAVIDCGVKLNIVRSLVTRGFEVIIYPYDTKYELVSDENCDGIVISNGPGDPKQCLPAIELARKAIDNSDPCLGICLGTQIIALSQGAETFKLKYGHRGQNKPCIDLKTGRCLVTSQNHGYSVEESSLSKTNLQAWFRNADDQTIEGLIHDSKPCVSVQFHPEASPGPVDASYVFDIFAEKVRRASS